MKGKDKGGGGDGGAAAAQNLLSDKPEGGILQGQYFSIGLKCTILLIVRNGLSELNHCILGLQQASDHVPEHQQLWLASSTLLFLFSCIGAMYTYIVVNPGRDLRTSM